jgi:hydrogenase/urease accessory protein HupE
VTRPLLLLLVLLGSLPSTAHEVRPALLTLQERATDRYELLWKVPTRGDAGLSLRPVLPSRCEDVGLPRRDDDGGALIERRQLRCPGGLAGAELAIEGLDMTLTDALLRIETLDGASVSARLTPGQARFTVPQAPTSLDVVRTYTLLGIEHIMLGLDHLLFVLALLLIVHGWRALVATITAFTAAHSLTLAAATLGWIHVPPGPVEATIALSILFLAAEIVHRRQGRPGLAARRPWLVAFLFGLLHGLGFAGALDELGLPGQAIPLALLFFNIGVEIGQLLFIAAVLVPVQLLRQHVAAHGRERAATALTYLIGSLAAYWTLSRIAGL